MYKITLLFQSNEKGIYTKEEETASEEFFKNLKYHRMIDRWLKILCSYIDKDEFISCINFVKKGQPLLLSEIYDQFILLIKNHLDILNKIDNGNRKFDITVEEF